MEKKFINAIVKWLVINKRGTGRRERRRGLRVLTAGAKLQKREEAGGNSPENR